MNKSIFMFAVVGLSLAGCASFDQDMVNSNEEIHRCNQAGIGLLGARLATTTRDTCVSSLEQLGYLKAQSRGSTGLVLGASERSVIQTAPVVLSVAENSPAARAGAKAGDLVLKVNGEPVLDVNLARRLLFGVAGEPVIVEIQRGFITTAYTLQRESADMAQAQLAIAKETGAGSSPD